MSRYSAILMTAAAIIAISEALSTSAADPDQVAFTTRNVATPNRRLLRTTSGTVEDVGDEERGILGEKALLRLSKLAEKYKKEGWAKTLEHKAWLKAGESPTSMFQKHPEWKGKSIAELKKYPEYIRYEGFAELWLAAQYKKGTLIEPLAWVKMVREQEKKNKAVTRNKT